MNNEPLHLTPRRRFALLLAILIGFALLLAVALTDTAGATPLDGICQRGVVTAFFDVPGGHVVNVIRSGHGFADAYWTTRHFWRTQRVNVCGGIVN